MSPTRIQPFYEPYESEKLRLYVLLKCSYVLLYHIRMLTYNLIIWFKKSICISKISGIAPSIRFPHHLLKNLFPGRMCFAFPGRGWMLPIYNCIKKKKILITALHAWRRKTHFCSEVKTSTRSI